MSRRTIPLPNSTHAWLMLSVSALVVLLGIVSIIAVDHRLKAHLLNDQRVAVRMMTRAFAAGSADLFHEGQRDHAEQIARRFTFEAALAEIRLERPDGELVAEAMGAVKAELDPGVTMIQCREQVFEGDTWIGTVAIEVAAGRNTSTLHKIRWVLVVIGLCGLTLGVLGVRAISTHMKNSLRPLMNGTIAVSQGDLNHRIEMRTGGDVGILAEQFNAMTERLGRQRREIANARVELELLNSTLEEKVSTRTREFLASEEKYRVLVESLPDPIVISQDGIVRFVNPAFEETFGYEARSMPRGELSTLDLFHDEDRPLMKEYIASILRGSAVEIGEVRGRTSTGATRLFQPRAMRITYIGEPATAVILPDTTERKELQDQLVQHEKMRALGELAGGVAHDFNNILGIILGRAQLLKQSDADEEVLKSLNTIERAAIDGGATVRRIQEFARARAEKQYENIDLNALVEEIVEITRTKWKDQAEVDNIRIDVSVDTQPVGNIRGDSSELREVYTNLIFNAVDAMPDGGKIEISTREEADETVVTMRDNGVGMPEHVCSRIFDPFFTTKGTNGMGLGMSVAYGIIERHGGRITVESKVGEGTCFTVRIPVSEQVEDVRPEMPESKISRLLRVLVVDDEQEILDLLRDILESEGVVAETANSGREALEAYEPGRFDLLFCDLGMREMTGWDVVREIRKQDSKIGVMLITGWGATITEEEIESHGVDAVVAKPFDMGQLLSTVAGVLEKRGGLPLAG